MSVSVFGEIRTWAVKLFDFHGKWMVLAEISLIFMVKRKESSVPLLVVQIHFMAPMVCPHAFTSSSLCTEACIFANNLSICPLSSIEFFYSGTKSISSLLLTCLLHGLPKTLLIEKLLESYFF